MDEWTMDEWTMDLVDEVDQVDMDSLIFSGSSGRDTGVR